MHKRKLAALLATTTVAATPTLVTSRAAGADAAPTPIPLHLDTGLDNMPSTLCELVQPTFDPNPMNGKPALIAQATGYKGGFCPDGSVELLFSSDHVHWKSMGSATVQDGNGAVEANLLHGDFWYQSYYITADGTAWGSTDSPSPVRIDC